MADAQVSKDSKDSEVTTRMSSLKLDKSKGVKTSQASPKKTVKPSSRSSAASASTCPVHGDRATSATKRDARSKRPSANQRRGDKPVSQSGPETLRSLTGTQPCPAEKALSSYDIFVSV